MKKKMQIAIPLLALVGLIFAVYTMVSTNRDLSSIAPPSVPYTVTKATNTDMITISGNGIVESSSENIKIGSHLSGVTNKVFVKVGQYVKKGAPLFQLDTSDAEAEVAVRTAQVEVAEAQLTKSMTRLKFYQDIDDKEAIAREELIARKNDAATSSASLLEAKANLQKAETQLGLHLVRSPIDGEILQVNIHPGEFAQAGDLSNTLIVLGDTRHLNVRVDIDEYDLGALHQNPTATISPKGNSAIKLNGVLVRVEPYLKPKQNLAGVGNELVDTRVLQLLFQIKEVSPPVFVGQQVDVTIESNKTLPLLTPQEKRS